MDRSGAIRHLLRRSHKVEVCLSPVARTSRCPSRSSVLLLLAFGLVAPRAGRAGGEEPPRPVSFAEALGLSGRTTWVQAAGEAAQTRKRIDDGRTGWANPQVTLQPGVRLAPGDQKGLDLGVSLLQGVSLGGLGAARRQGAGAEEALFDAAALSVALEQRLAAARTWIDLRATESVLAGVRSEVVLAEELAALVAKARKAEAATAADLELAKTFLAEARLLALDVEGEQFERALALAAELGEPAGTLTCAGPLPSMEVPSLAQPALPADLARLTAGLPLVRVQRLKAQVERAREAEERAARAAHLAVGLTAYRDGAGAGGAGGTLQLTLPAFDRGGREAGLRAAEAVRSEGEASRAQTSALVELRRALHEVEHTGEIVALLEKELEPAAAEASRLTERLFASSEVPLTEVLLARRATLSAHARVERARAAHAWARVRAFLTTQAAL
jgi:cobalt-zinc-cadmium efflux system outer membrane protein